MHVEGLSDLKHLLLHHKVLSPDLRDVLLQGAARRPIVVESSHATINAKGRDDKQAPLHRIRLHRPSWLPNENSWVTTYSMSNAGWKGVTIAARNVSLLLELFLPATSAKACPKPMIVKYTQTDFHVVRSCLCLQTHLLGLVEINLEVL